MLHANLTKGFLIWTDTITFVIIILSQYSICITFVQCWSNVEDVGPMLYTCFVCTGVFSLYDVVLRIKLGVIVMGMNQSDYIDLGDVNWKKPTDLKRRKWSCQLIVHVSFFWIVILKLSGSSYKNISEHTRHPPVVAVMLGQRRRRWTNITAISGQSIVFAF